MIQLAWKKTGAGRVVRDIITSRHTGRLHLKLIKMVTCRGAGGRTEGGADIPPDL